MLDDSWALDTDLLSSLDLPQAGLHGGTPAPRTTILALPRAQAEARVFDGLNPEQIEAVRATAGPVRILAPAGSGKTEVITRRTAYIALTTGTPANDILVLTFTNKAATDMRRRIAAFLDRDADADDLPDAGTFHWLGCQLLRMHPNVGGLQPDFQIADPDAQFAIVLRLIAEAYPATETNKHQQRKLATQVQWALGAFKDAGYPPSEIAVYAAENGIAPFTDRTAAPTPADAQSVAVALYEDYQLDLRRQNLVDFGDLLLWPTVMMRRSQRYRTYVASLWRYVMVDEYQDTNTVQDDFIELIASTHGNLCICGDDDQSLYEWRSAKPEYIRNFDVKHPNAKTIILERNYRSSVPILEASSALIRHNANRVPKTIRAGRVIAHVHLGAVRLPTPDLEADYIAQRATERIAAGTAPAQCAILVRAASMTRVIETALRKRQLPYVLYGDTAFFERKEIRDVVSYLRVALFPTSDEDFRRVINTPRREVGPAQLRKIAVVAKDQRMSLQAAARRLAAENAFPRRAQEGVESFLRAIDTALANVNPGALLRSLLGESGYLAQYEASQKPEDAERLDNIKELLNLADTIPDTARFLDYIGLMTGEIGSKARRPRDAIQIMTLHKSKALEFDAVWLPRWTENEMPNERALKSDSEEEERRLGYVGMSRARIYCEVTCPAEIYDHIKGAPITSTPSRFIAEAGLVLQDLFSPFERPITL